MMAIALASSAAAGGKDCTDLWPTCMDPTLPHSGCVIECQPGDCPDGFRCTIVFATNVSGDPPGDDGCPGFVAAVCLPEPATPDLDGDGSVNELDLATLLSSWGPCDDCFSLPCPADLNRDCRTGATDLLSLLAAWLAGS